MIPPKLELVRLLLGDATCVALGLQLDAKSGDLGAQLADVGAEVRQFLVVIRVDALELGVVRLRDPAHLLLVPTIRHGQQARYPQDDENQSTVGPSGGQPT
jgi:hypothetical protein